MRISIREQLGLLVALTALTALAVIAVATWVNNSRFVVSIRSSGLALTASLKAASVSASLLLVDSTVRTVSTRVLIQRALQRYREDGNTSSANWVSAQADLQAALAGGATLLVQAIIFPAYDNGTGAQGILNATSAKFADRIDLPYVNGQGKKPMLGDSSDGYPSSLYPELTLPPLSSASNNASGTSWATYGGRTIDEVSSLLLGPLTVNSTFALLSLTVPVINNTASNDVLGYMTVLVDARLIYDIVDSPEGLENSGGVLILGPDTGDNRFPPSDQTDGLLVRTNNQTNVQDLRVKVLWAPLPGSSAAGRHQQSGWAKPNPSFPIKQFPAVSAALTDKDNDPNGHAGSILSSTNEEGKSVAVGYARPRTSVCDWVLVVEQDHYQAMEPVRHLQNVLLACVFGTTGVLLLAVFPIAHWSVRPIRRLRQATKASVEPPGYDAEASSGRLSSSPDSAGIEPGMEGEKEDPLHAAGGRREGVFFLWRRARRRKTANGAKGTLGAHGHVRIPKKVPDKKHFIQDELTDLTTTFNEMSDELMSQYTKLEDRVRERTRELEQSKKVAEAANESKTLFIANISHEFRTPLNAILGLTAVCMEETEMSRIQRSLGIIYRSGDLLLHLITDLLTFSKNQMGQQLTLDEREFRIGDITAQILSIFEKQAKEGNVDLRASYSQADGDNDLSLMLFGSTNLEKWYVWGDQNRILQVIINLVSNSLKFTPPGETIDMRIRCLETAEPDTLSRKTSSASKTNPTRPVILREHDRSEDATVVRSLAVEASSGSLHPAPSIQVAEGESMGRMRTHDRSPSPLAGQVKTRMFEFEIEDTGPGIPDDLHQKVFEPFVQGDLGLSKKYGGTGLGLSICSQLAKLMGGNITLRSQLGVGSTFTMRIPLKVMKADARPASRSNSSSTSNLHSRANSMRRLKSPTDDSQPSDDPATSSREHKPDSSSTLSSGPAAKPSLPGAGVGSKPRLVGLSQPFFTSSSPLDSGEQPTLPTDLEPQQKGRLRVLVAEDNKINQEVVLRMLKLEDIYDVTVAKDGQEAFDKVKESMEQNRMFHLIFMDVQMPNVDGLQSTRLIREMGYSSPIVALTAFAEESNFRECSSVPALF
ncbi:MAG: Histidine kinase [Phylliscum demangeonii]|nr:MAG: Histidine kinase [Phylliscum demangeonii]